MTHAGKAAGKGGLALLFEMVLGGLVGTSPHMISASVMALARLLHQFADELGGEPHAYRWVYRCHTCQLCILRPACSVIGRVPKTISRCRCSTGAAPCSALSAAHKEP